MVSGLSVGSDTAALDMKAELLVEWLTGEVGGVSVSSTTQALTEFSGPYRGREDSPPHLRRQHPRRAQEGHRRPHAGELHFARGKLTPETLLVGTGQRQARAPDQDALHSPD